MRVCTSHNRRWCDTTYRFLHVFEHSKCTDTKGRLTVDYHGHDMCTKSVSCLVEN
jgi:hypothetical protein